MKQGLGERARQGRRMQKVEGQGSLKNDSTVYKKCGLKKMKTKIWLHTK